ncbi:MAG: DUF11 domain-containing protein [Firmicutes bacterium]|nr:DUF11 domain-containing protein [Bacillota bacterium]
MTQENQAFLDIELCDEAVIVESEVSETEILDLTITKESDCPYAVIGGTICYTVTITNNTDHTFDGRDDTAFSPLVFRDPLAENLEYIVDTFTFSINGAIPPTHGTPTIDTDNIMTFDDWTIPPQSTVVVEFCVRVKRPTPPTVEQ